MPFKPPTYASHTAFALLFKRWLLLSQRPIALTSISSCREHSIPEPSLDVAIDAIPQRTVLGSTTPVRHWAHLSACASSIVVRLRSGVAYFRHLSALVLHRLAPINDRSQGMLFHAVCSRFRFC